LDLAVAEERLLGRIDDDDAVVAVDDQLVAGFDPLGQVAHRDDGGHLHGAGDHDGVARLAPGIGDDRERRTAVDARGIGGRKVVGHHDPLFRQAAEAGLGLAQQVLQDPLRDVADVAGALAQVLIVDLRKRMDVALRDAVEAGLDVPAGAFEIANGLGDEGLVLQHEQVRVKDPGLVGAEVLLDLALDLRDLLAGDDQRLVETRDLVDAFFQIHLVGRNFDLALDVDEDLAIGDALRGGDALHHDFLLGRFFR